MSECIFCKIVAGDIPSHQVYEDEHVLAFMDINPSSSLGHVLVIPKKHSSNLFEIPFTDLVSVSAASQKIARALDSLGADGVNIVQSNGKAAQQDVFHYHMHVIARSESDEKLVSYQPQETDHEKLASRAEKIREKITSPS